MARDLWQVPSEGSKTYHFARQQQLLAAAFPDKAKHFQQGYLYLDDVGLDSDERIDHPLTYLRLTVKDRNMKEVQRRVHVQDSTINLDAVRWKFKELNALAKTERVEFEQEEARHEPYSISLTPREARLVLDSPRCECGHLEVFHDSTDHSSNVSGYCSITGCRCG